MTEFEVLSIRSETLEALKGQLLKRPKVFNLKSDLEFSSWLISYGITREVGTKNDELSRFVFDAPSGRLVDRDSLRADVIRIKDKIGVRISSSQSSSLEIRIRGFRSLVHPSLSENADGSYHQIVIFPEIIANIAALEDVELVIVKPWALNSIFGGFSSTEEYYATNFWELETNDSTLFAELLQEKRLALLGTHDLIAHVAGITREAWETLPEYARWVQEGIQAYLGNKEPSIPDLVLPYTVGVILDDLAQPPSYQSLSHITMLKELLRAMEVPSDQQKSKVLLKYPSIFEQVIRLSRDKTITQERAQGLVRKFLQELKESTAQIA